jgi:hypothetical protein
MDPSAWHRQEEFVGTTCSEAVSLSNGTPSGHRGLIDAGDAHGTTLPGLGSEFGHDNSLPKTFGGIYAVWLWG